MAKSKNAMSQYPSPKHTMGSEPKQAEFSSHPGHGSARRTAAEAGTSVESRNFQPLGPR